jgi:hypothetical protein
MYLGGFIFTIDLDVKICKHHLADFFVYTIGPFSNKNLSQEEIKMYSFLVMQVLHVVEQQLFYQLYIYLCICYTYDLHLTIKNPLYPAGKRMKLYGIL